MKRRDVVKGLSLVAAGALCPEWAMSAGKQDQDEEKTHSFALPIRGLVRKSGQFLQPIQLTIPAGTASRVVVTKLNGADVDRRALPAGNHVFKVFVPPVTAPQQCKVECEIDGRQVAATITLKPVRKILVYILPHSHHDLGYTDLQANVEEKQMRNITLGMDLARRTAAYPEGARFVWNLEVLWGADLLMRRKTEAEKTAFIQAVKKGWVALNGMYANELTGLCRPEELLQLFRFGGELGRTCGVSVDSAMVSDVPGFTWGTVTAMAHAGIRYFSVAPNYFDRIGTFMLQWQDKPFWWVSPSGKEKVLVWVPWTGYAMSHVMKVGDEWVDKYQDRLDSVNFPYDVSYIRWSGHGDNAEPDPEICEFVKAWNEEYVWPKFSIASTGTAFSAFEKRHGNDLPQLKGDLTPYWEDGAGSSALETAMNRRASDRLVQAETLAAMISPNSYQPAVFHNAWRNILLYSEHTWGAWCSVSDSENTLTREQWNVKRAFAVDAEEQSEVLLAKALASREVNSDSAAIDVYNCTSWLRTEVVVVPKKFSIDGDRVQDDRGVPTPSQRLSTGELAFVANEVPAFGNARFHISSGAAMRPSKPVTVEDNILQNGILRARVDDRNGNIVELGASHRQGNLVDLTGGQAVNQYLFLEGQDVSHIQTNGPVKITLEEAGPLIALLRIESTAPGCNRLVRTLKLAAGADWVELTNVLDKKRAPLNPHPGAGGPGDEFAQHQGKESVQFAFPFAIPDGKIHMDIPLAIMQPEVDQLPGSCKNWLSVGRWIDVANAGNGVTWVSLDAPLVEIGGISATMLGSQKDPGVWRQHIEPTQTFYSWVMNNHWGTNYRAYQEGTVEFHYALRPHTRYDPALASRLAVSLSLPLLVSRAATASTIDSIFVIEPDDVLPIAFKPSEDGRAWIVRLFGASGENRKARLRWTKRTTPTSAPRMWLSDLTEQPLTPIASEIEVAGLDVVTVRIEQT
ncbi:MAG TPA: glycosyl hydrolase-related protein [Nitrospiraceae bacterium]|nr:glycosyl hydrolase-related protein [Nitrospiraceae bacterium]